MTLIIIGLLSGIISGMGIGGGTILIPSIILFTSLTQQQAQGINLIVFIPISIVALVTHYINKNIKFEVVLPLIASGIIGALIGSTMAINISSHTLKLLFAIFLFSMGIYEVIKKPKK